MDRFANSVGLSTENGPSPASLGLAATPIGPVLWTEGALANPSSSDPGLGVVVGACGSGVGRRVARADSRGTGREGNFEHLYI